MKNLVLCCDGTANEFSKDRTNVVKLFSVLEQDPLRQAVYYHPGLGTMEAPGALLQVSKHVSRIAGLAFGSGLDRDVRDAYVFLMKHFEAGDRIFLFGFSRGAYTARAVASLLRMYGLIPWGNEPLVPYAFRMMAAINRIKDRSDANPYFRLADEFKETFGQARACKPHFVGVWDTVSSVGWIENPVHLPFTASNPDIEIGRHALAIDERRAFFRTNLWRPRKAPPEGGPRDLKQVWFAGVHSDVGGGYPESQSGLAKISLKWMLREAIEAGLLVDARKMDTVLGSHGGGQVAPDPKAEAHESLTFWWWPGELFFKRHWDWKRRKERRRMNLGRRRTIPEGADVHRSVQQRGEEYCRRLPAKVNFVD
jgi:uncharacterized protein (DUF2235 family)